MKITKDENNEIIKIKIAFSPKRREKQKYVCNVLKTVHSNFERRM